MADLQAQTNVALTAVVNEMLAMADELEAQATAWAAALERLGEERAAELRRKAYEVHLRRRREEPLNGARVDRAAAANDGEHDVAVRERSSSNG